jgi:NAD-dependent dihydropyrimidine dehydrogenase PreA subunit/bacterioferritin-associated ferredoxin
MKTVTLLSQVDSSKCTGCRTCERVCPVLAIKVVQRKAVVEAEHCRGCANCEQRCPVNAVTMIKRKTPLEVGVNVNSVNYDAIKKLCRQAKLNPEQTICYCVGVRAEEAAAAILKGAKTPEEVSLATGVRTGCSIECIQPVLRLLEAAGHELRPVEGGWQWYGRTVTAWDLPEAVKRKYAARGFYFEEDRKVLDEIVAGDQKGGKR